MARIEMIKTVECPRLNGEEIVIERCQACKHHLNVREKSGKVICNYP